MDVGREKLSFAVHGWSSISAESLHVRPQEDGSYEIESLPFFFQGATLGDIVIVWEEVEGQNEAQVCGGQGNSLIRVFVPEQSDLESLHAAIKRKDLLVERFDQYGLLAVNVDKTAPYSTILNWLADEAGEVGGELEEALCRHS